MKSVLVAALAGISGARRLSQRASASAAAITEHGNYLHARGNGPGLGDCTPYQEGAAPLPDKDNWESFMAMGEYSDYAKKAAAPSNYSKAFENLNATVNHESYIGVHTIYAYEPSVCANWCNLNSYCKAFNIYVSRDPSRDPGPGCANPPATANFKCALFGEQINAAQAINEGQRQPPADDKGVEFYVRVRGSNGYNGNAKVVEHKISPPISGFKGPYVQTCAFNASEAANEPADLVGTTHHDGIYNVQTCANLCNKMTDQRKAEAEKNCANKDSAQVCEFTPCNFFNAYTTKSDDSEPVKGFYCSLYTLRMPDQFSTVTEPKDAAGNEHKVIDSFAYDRHPTVKNFVHGSRDSFLARISTSAGASSACPTETNTETRTTTKTETQTSIYTAVSVDYVTVTSVREHTVTVTAAPSGHLAPRDGSKIRHAAGQPIETEATPTSLAEMFDAVVDKALASAIALGVEIQDAAAAAGVGEKDTAALSLKSWRSKFFGGKDADSDDDDSEEDVIASDAEEGEEDAWVE